MKRNRFLRVFKIAFMALIAISLFSFIVMYLWNLLIPSIFTNVAAINFWQAVGLLVLSKILFGGFRPYPGRGAGWRRRMMGRWERMTPEEREKFKQGMRGVCHPARNREAEVKA